MLRYSDTTVFNVDAQVIVNTVNCVGVMGNGVARECRLRFPEMFAEYVERCRDGEVAIGKPYIYWYSGQRGILNFPAKMHWKYPSRYEWIAQGLAGMVSLLQRERVVSVAVPPLGCDLGKLDWRRVQPMLEQSLTPLSTESIVCLDREERATGVEGRMLELLNDTTHPFWISVLRLNTAISTAILASVPINHFREVRDIPGVGKQTYERLHRLLYAMVDMQAVQGGLFA